MDLVRRKVRQSFEQSFAQWCEATDGVALMNGTVALHLALRLGFLIGPLEVA